MGRKEFEAKVEAVGPNGAWTRFTLPFSAEEVFGSKARVSVSGTLNGCEFRSTIFPNGDGTHHMMLNKALLKNARAAAGDTVKVVMESDGVPRSVELPAELTAALSRWEAAAAEFAKLAPSHKREYANWVDEAKRPETRARRAEKAIEMVLAGQRVKG